MIYFNKVQKGYRCSVSRSIGIDLIENARKMEAVAKDIIEHYGDDEYHYYIYTHEYYPGNCIFELDVHMKWSKSARHENSPMVYMSWSRCDFEAEQMMNLIIKTYLDNEGA